jgi:uncharacterized integral membrane protein (TIGR00697 family)
MPFDIPNEILLLISAVIVYASLLFWFAMFGKAGVYGFTVFTTILANIEVMILVDAFGIEMTLGNMLFSSTFLTTEILSEMYSKEDANRAVKIGIVTSVTMIIITQSWLLYTPNGNDWAFGSIKTLFSNTPRLMFASLIVYAIVQWLDVWIYHLVWDFTTRRSGDSERFLWLRNCIATLISQLANTILYTIGAFYGVYEFSTLFDIVVASYAIFAIINFADLPFMYLARYIYKKFPGKKHI